MAGGIAVLPLHTYWDSIICCYIVIHLNVPCVIVMRWQHNRFKGPYMVKKRKKNSCIYATRTKQ
jgi:hypothetical protein